MDRMKRIGWILVGVVIGALATGSMAAVRQLPEPPQRRLVVFMDNQIGRRTASLIKDTRGDGCWLMITTGNADGPVAIAPAPASACYDR